jgi:hypothetical protein
MSASPLPDPASCAFFAPIAQWTEALRALGRWPEVAEIDRELAASARVRFATAARRARTRRREAKPEAGYDASIVDAGVVPTRRENLHDLMNSLVWARFPLAKRALHERQRALVERADGSGRRTIEHDTIAMLDEGGVLLFADRASNDADAAPRSVSPSECIVFGHAIYQHLAEGRAPVFGLGVPVGEALVGAPAGDVDRALAGMLADGERFSTHRWLPRVSVG